MNLNKHAEFYDPSYFESSIHIIGVGAIGSTLAEMLTRLGFPELHLYDFDTVSDHNITNQMYVFSDIGKPKVEACTAHLKAINPDIVINAHPKGYTTETTLSGYVFLCVDSIDLRKEITTTLQYNSFVKGVFDFRMRLTDAQHYAVDWEDPKGREFLLSTMNFTKEEAAEATPMSACGTSLSVTPTVRNIVGFGAANFLNHLKGAPLKKMIMMDAFAFNVITM